MKKSIEINFKYTEKEYVSAMRSHYLGSYRTIFDLILAIILIITGYFLYSSDPKSMINMLMLVMGILFLFAIVFAIYINPKRIFKSQPKFREEYFLTFSDDGILFITEHINSNLKWNHYEKFKENNKFYYLTYGESMLTIIPKRAFSSTGDEEEFRNLLKSKLKTK